MSLINQVLSDLEKRGAGGIPLESAIRPVSVQRNPRKAILSAAIGGISVIFVVAGLWWGSLQHKPDLPESRLAVNTMQSSIQAASAPQAETQSQPDALSVNVGDAPAMHLSPELSTLPPPVALSAKPVRTAPPVLPESKIGHADALTHPAPLKEQKVPPSVVSEPERNKVALSPDPAGVQKGSVDKQIKPLSVQQQADNEFRKANTLMQQGRIDGAIEGYATALQLDADHDAARQAMVGLLLESKRIADAEGVLQAGLTHNPKNSGFAMLLARLQVERSALPQALETLQKTLPYAEQQADYQAFIAAVQQRMGQHKEAVEHYQMALKSSPDSGVWLMGLGISLKALQQKDAAGVAFKHALDSHTLSAELQAFITQQLKEVQIPKPAP
jgi:MSHA biogenesis protein MshN